MANETDYIVTFTAPEKAELLSQPRDPKPLDAKEVTGRTIVSLVSPGTELNSAYVGGKYPNAPGYAAVFEVEAAGSAVTDMKPGDLVFCTGPQGIGGHRSRQRCPREAALPLPKGLSPEVAVHARLMNVSMTTLSTTTARPPDKVLVLGLGPVGHLAAQIFRGCGYQVLAVDPSEPRRRLLQEKGFAHVFPATPLDQKALLDGIGLALECSGHEQAALDGLRAIRKRGEVVQVGVPWKRRSELHAFEVLEAVFRKYATLRSGWEWENARYTTDFRIGSVFGNLAGALQWLAEGRVKVDGLYQKAPPREAQRVYQELLHGTLPTLSVVFDWQQVP